MSQEFKIALISSDQEIVEDLRHILERELRRERTEEISVKNFPAFPSVEDTIINYLPNLIVVFVENHQKDEALDFLYNLTRVAERVSVVVAAQQLDADLMLAGVKRGVRDFIKYPFDEVEIREMLRRLAYEANPASEQAQTGTTFSFFSYKGGLGTTFLACNMAVALARRTKGRVLLWDLVIQNGDVPFFFDYEPQATVTDLLENLAKIDDVYLRGILPVHSSGVSILAGPKRPEEWEAIRNNQLHGLHQIIRKYYDYIVIDAGHSLTDQIISAMDLSKHILLITDLHLPVLKNTLRCIDVFERLGYPEGKFKIVLNRYNSKYQKFDLSKAEEILHYPISYSIPNDYVMVSRSLNAGIPVADLDPASLLAKQFNEFAELLLNDFKASEKRSSSFLGQFKGMFGSKNHKDKPKDSVKQGKVKEQTENHAA